MFFYTIQYTAEINQLTTQEDLPLHPTLRTTFFEWNNKKAQENQNWHTELGTSASGLR
jgi:hypothetical protein